MADCHSRPEGPGLSGIYKHKVIDSHLDAFGRTCGNERLFRLNRRICNNLMSRDADAGGGKRCFPFIPAIVKNHGIRPIQGLRRYFLAHLPGQYKFDTNFAMKIPLLLSALLLLSLACSGDKKADFPAQIAGVYEGIIPCADCEGIRVILRLDADSTFLMENTYLEAEGGQDRSFYDLGRWEISRDKITLRGGEEEKFYRLVDGQHLQMLDSEGNQILSPANYTLTKTAKIFPPATPFPLEGRYSYQAGAGRFSECRSGKTYPVAFKGENARVESEYSRIRREPGEEIFLSVEGYFAPLPDMEGNLKEQLVITRFIRFEPGKSCAGAEIFHHPGAGFRFRIPSQWKERYQIVETKPEMLKTILPAAAYMVEFWYLPVDSAYIPQALLAIAAVANENIDALLAEPGPPAGEVLGKGSGYTYLASLPQSNPFVSGSEDYKNFQAMELTLQEIKNSLEYR